MAIEPLGSVMSMQVQTSMPQKPVVERVEEPVKLMQATEIVDQTTPVVEGAQSKGQGKNNSSTEQNAEQQITNEQIKKAVEKLNKSMPHSEALYGIHEKTNRVTIKIVDKETKEVIKELPPEKTLDMIAKVWELAGILVDEKR